MEATSTAAKPVVKWAGGKRKLLNEILTRAPQNISTYYEPFVGGGAVFFALANRRAFKRAVLSDVNEELINTYKVIQSDALPDLIDLLKTYPHSREFYSHLRVTLPKSNFVRAARFIYLNRTGYNGLYRVNSRGEFNVPFGRYVNPTICDTQALQRAHDVLQGVELNTEDFTLSTQHATSEDWVYMDPPYLPISETSSFTHYTRKGFSFADHAKIAEVLSGLQERGVQALLSNSDAQPLRALFSRFKIESVSAPRAINSVGSRRGRIGELLITNEAPT